MAGTFSLSPFRREAVILFNNFFMLSLITIPSATSTIEGMSEWSAPFFAEIWPYMLIVLGLGFVAFAIRWIGGIFSK